MCTSRKFVSQNTKKYTKEIPYLYWTTGNIKSESYDFSDFQEGVTTKGEMRVALRLKDRRTTSVPGSLYVGLASVSLENREDMGSVYERVTFNMRELTTDIVGWLMRK